MNASAAANWDMSAFFPSFEGPERRDFGERLGGDAARLTEQAAGLALLSSENAAAWEGVVIGYEELSTRLSHLASYVHAIASCDADNESYRAEVGRLSVLSAAFQKLSIELLRGIGSASAEAFESFVARERLASARFYLERLKEEAAHMMDPKLEALAADLGTDGIEAWGRLYDTLSGTLAFEMEFPDGRRERVPMSQRRSLMGDVDRRVREHGFRSGNLAWQGVAPIAAAALNHIAGTRHTLNARRKVGHFLDVALFDAAISRRTLDAMFEAIHQNAEIPRRFLRLKARALGIDKISWFDLEAPLPLPSASRVSWERGRQLVSAAFGRAYPRLGKFFDMAIERRWVESEPRRGKQPGAYCTSSKLIGESRVFMTFNGSLGDVSTLAHEIGHAFHNHVMRELRPFLRSYPMTLAESASVFAEALLSEGLLSDPKTSDPERALLLNEQLGDAVAFLLDIPVRFEFEKAFYEERRQGDLSVSRLSELMADTQKRIFGDTLDDSGTDPLFWASKLHFFITGVSFYNFPYSFGYLLSRGLFAEYERQGPAFLERYEEFLRLTGNGMAHEIASRALGQNLEAPEFWAAAIRTLEDPLAKLAELMPKVLPASAPV
jgi:oligoendopeptidase F